MMRFNRNIANLIVGVLLIASLTSCSNEKLNAESSDNKLSSKDIELLDPVGSSMNYETAKYRNIDKVSAYPGIVSPDSIEISYESELLFGGYSYLPGEKVTKGDLLVETDDKTVDEKIELVAEANADLTENYADYLTDYVYSHADAKKAFEEAASAYQERFAYEPDEASSAHAMWEKALMGVEKGYKSADLNLKRMEEEYLEKQQLYELEYAYNEKKIAILNSSRNEGQIMAPKDGTVVATFPALPGDSVAIGTHMIAIGDLEEKEIVCDFISNSVISKALDYYAIVDGKRYEVVHEEMTTDEYNKLKNLNGEVFSTFKIVDGQDVELGSYAVIVVIEKQTQNILTIPKGAVSHDELGDYVYLVKDGESVYTQVTTGVSNSIYVEILAGLNEGDKVVYDNPYRPAVNAKYENVSVGGVETKVNATGYLYYPSATWLKNPAKRGTCYVKELCVERYEQVSEGQVVAKIEVVADSIEIDRIKQKILRQQERIVDLTNEKTLTYNENELRALDKAIAERNRTIEKLNKDLNKLTEYVGVIELKAKASGIVTDIVDLKEGELLYYGQNLVQLAFSDSGYIIVEDKEHQFAYGNEASITYKDSTGKSIEAVGEVVTLNGSAMNADLKGGYVLIKLSDEDIALIAEGGSQAGNGYWNRNRYSVNITIRSMKDVLLVPKSAVKMIGGEAYVYVTDEEGNTELTYCVPGGADLSYYWVAYGLKEGIKLCLG